MTKIGDFSNRANFHQPVSSRAEQRAVFKLKHPGLAQILGALEQGCNPATRFLMNNRLAKMSMPIRQKISATLQNFVNEIRQQIELENARHAASQYHHAPRQFQSRSRISIEEILRNPINSTPRHQVPPGRPQNFSAPPSPHNQQHAEPPPTASSEPPSTSSRKAESTASSNAAHAGLPRLSMRERPDASHIKQLRANGMSDSDLMTLKDDMRALRESGGNAAKQDEFDEKYAHLFNSATEGGIRDNSSNYAVLWMLITKEVRKKT